MTNMHTQLPYCTLCGNEKTAAEDRIGDACRLLIAGPLALPWKFCQECESRQPRCCGGVAGPPDDPQGFYFHSKGWECSYGDSPNSVAVEMGIEFRLDGAQTYYIYDTDNSSEGVDYGALLPYPADPADSAFWDALDKQLDRAAEAAWNADVLTCESCGYHYYGPNGPCGCEGEEEEG